MNLDPRTVTFEDVVKLIHFACRKHQRLYGGEYDIIFSDACFLYLQAYTSYDRKKSQFTSWLMFKILRGLAYNARKERIRRRNLPTEEDGIPMDELPQTSGNFFDLEDFFMGLTKDAATIVKIILNQPIDIRAEIAIRGRETASRVRSSIRTYLQYKGWEMARIKSAFRDIQKAFLYYRLE